MASDVFSAQEEFDVSDASSLPVLNDVLLTITDFEVVEKEEGKTAHRITFESSELPFPVRKNYWFQHPNQQAQSIGRAELKKIALAATGSARYNTTSLLNQQIIGSVSEDAAGFPQVKRVKRVNGQG